MLAESVCPCHDGRCDCDACWHMREASAGAVKASPLCACRGEIAGSGENIEDPGDRIAKRPDRTVKRADPVADVERVARRRERVCKGLSYDDAAARCGRHGAANEMWRAAFPACVFPAAHGLPLGERVPAAWKKARDWCVREVAQETGKVDQ